MGKLSRLLTLLLRFSFIWLGFLYLFWPTNKKQVELRKPLSILYIESKIEINSPRFKIFWALLYFLCQLIRPFFTELNFKGRWIPYPRPDPYIHMIKSISYNLKKLILAGNWRIISCDLNYAGKAVKFPFHSNFVNITNSSSELLILPNFLNIH